MADHVPKYHSEPAWRLLITMTGHQLICTFAAVTSEITTPKTDRICVQQLLTPLPRIICNAGSSISRLLAPSSKVNFDGGRLSACALHKTSSARERAVLTLVAFVLP